MARAAMVRSAVAVAAALTLAGSPAMAAEDAAGEGLSVAIDSPSEGTVVDRTTTSVVDVSGSAQFVTPAPAERTFYVRGGCAGDTGPTGLSVIRGEGAGACAMPASVTPVADVARVLGVPTSVRFTTVDGVPFALDSSRRLTGELAMVSLCCEPGMPGVGAGQTTVDITVTGRIRNDENVSIEHRLGQTSVTYTATPMETYYRNSWSINLPQRYDRNDVWDLTLILDVHGVNAMHGFVVSNLSSLTVPIYDASFRKRVDIAIDGDWFRSDGVTVSEDGSRWTAAIPVPSAGVHKIRARAVQGGATSTIAERAITVTG